MARRKGTIRSQRGPALTANTADKHDLYEQSVQQADVDVGFMHRIFRSKRGRTPLSLREDFCGTAWMCAEWVKSRKDRTAIGLDLHGPTLDYGRKKHLRPLGAAEHRVQLMERDVRRGAPTRSDIVAAFNFSYCVFKERAALLAYCKSVRRQLNRDGLFLLDLYGGPDAQCELEEERKKKGFTYVWDQKPYDALSGCAIRHIHFRFPDGTRLNKAFRYDWRIWSLPELRDVLLEAGFTEVDVYWEGATEDGEGNGVFRKVRKAENEEAWIAYVAAWR